MGGRKWTSSSNAGQDFLPAAHKLKNTVGVEKDRWTVVHLGAWLIRGCGLYLGKL